MIISKELSRGFMAANLIGTLLVVAIHYDSSCFIEEADIRGWNHTFQEFAINGIARSAVPLFSFLAGFFLTARLGGFQAYTRLLATKARTLLIPYLIGATSIFMASVILQVPYGPVSYPYITYLHLVRDIFVQPISVQFWFLRDLMILILLSPLLLSRKLALHKLFIFTSGVLWFFGIQPFPKLIGWYLLNIETLFFFCLGSWFFQHQSLLEAMMKAQISLKVIVAGIWFALIGLRIYLDPQLDVWYVQHYTTASLFLYKVAIIVGIVSLLQMSSHIASQRWVIHYSGLTFFAYLYHHEPLSYLLKHHNPVPAPQYGFYLNFPMAILTVFMSGHLLSKYMPGFFALISGGRSPRKTLQRILIPTTE